MFCALLATFSLCIGIVQFISVELFHGTEMLGVSPRCFLCPQTSYYFLPRSSPLLIRSAYELYCCHCRLLTFPAAVVTPCQRRQSSGGSAAAVWPRWAVQRRHQQREGNGGSAVAALEAVAAASSGGAAAAVAERQRRRQHGNGGSRVAAG